MKTEYVCPDCHTSLHSNIKSCACGWKPPIKKIHNTLETNCTPYCQYIDDKGRPCKQLGTMSHSTFGKAWYCSQHWWLAKNHTDPPKNIKEQKQTLSAQSSDWSKKLAQTAPHYPKTGEK